MSKFIQDGTGLVVSVADAKDDRFVSGWKPFDDDKSQKASTARAKKTDNN